MPDDINEPGEFVRRPFRKDPVIQTATTPIEHDEVFILRKVVKTLAGAEGYQAAAHAGINRVCDTVGWDLSSVWRVDEEAGGLVLDVSCGRNPELTARSAGVVIPAVRAGSARPGRPVSSSSRRANCAISRRCSARMRRSCRPRWPSRSSRGVASRGS
ncbi:hypothetical protein GCM10025883_45350 [Mobilicoccus caccae]|uniref:Uncharacterized protein n=1 Tax=Mobilicoccus caccae TaxID=1859295 RepID=A0ABQ6IX11_9MICO|nr:hypothetical protein [Mobilicoccus caccae]GMA42490.1 hypothetical protein GCM10025883_45350 [Mobilicoccus caccae]